MNDSVTEIELIPYDAAKSKTDSDLDRIIFDLDSQIDGFSAKADTLDYIISIASGILCASLDVLFVGDFDFERGRRIADDKVNGFVKKTAHLLGCEDDDLTSCVKFLEKKFPIPSDRNTPDFGGGLQHHLRDFAHHPTIVGLIFSLLTQFTYKSYGTDTSGGFIVVDVPEAGKAFIGDDIPTKIIYGTVTWFFHLVSDVAGSGGTAGFGGGTGIPGPILSLAKELSALPLFRNMKIGDNSLSVFLSKLFNGTLFAEHDENGRIIRDSLLRLDLRGELGVGIELPRQAVPVIANECIVRTFWFIRRFAEKLRDADVNSIGGLSAIIPDFPKPSEDPTLARMLTIATGVFTTIDIGAAVITKKYLVAVNFAGVGRFGVAIGQDVSWCLKARNLKKLRQMYDDIRQNTYRDEDDRIYTRMGRDTMNIDRFGLTVGQTEILYNLEYLKTQNDIDRTKLPVGGERIKELKSKWLREWKDYMTRGFSGFLNNDNAELSWYSAEELTRKIMESEPDGTWLRLVLLEAMLFEPYFPLSTETDKKGNEIPSKYYNALQNPVNGYRKTDGDSYLDAFLIWNDSTKGCVKRFRRCYDRVLFELNEVMKTVLKSLSITAGVALVTVATAGAFAPAIAVALVGSNFAGLSGAALTGACLAYLGGGAVAAGGLGMAGGTIAIVGGGAALGIGVGAGVGGVVGMAGLSGKKNVILQSAKLLVAVREIFLNDEHDIAYSDSVYEQYVNNIANIEKELVDLRLHADTADTEEKKKIREMIKRSEETVDAMKIAKKSMEKFVSSFKTGVADKAE